MNSYTETSFIQTQCTDEMLAFAARSESPLENALKEWKNSPRAEYYKNLLNASTVQSQIYFVEGRALDYDSN